MIIVNQIILFLFETIIIHCNAPAICSDILWSGNVWSYAASGVNLSPYTNNELQLLVCITEQGCDTSSFFCNADASSITFGTTDSTGNTLHALLGPGSIPPTYAPGCCSSSNHRYPCNSPNDQVSVTKLCQQLGYDGGTFTPVSSNICPEVNWDGSQWTSDFAPSVGYGKQYTCNYTPTVAPTPSPTNKPTPAPTNNPTPSPTGHPTPSPTNNPTPTPSKNPTASPTHNPTPSPTPSPTTIPTINPSSNPSLNPSKNPTTVPTNNPTSPPTKNPTQSPTIAPTLNPTPSPINNPTHDPSKSPTKQPTTPAPTIHGVIIPTHRPNSNNIIINDTNPTIVIINDTKNVVITDQHNTYNKLIITIVVLAAIVFVLCCIGTLIVLNYRRMTKNEDNVQLKHGNTPYVPLMDMNGNDNDGDLTEEGEEHPKNQLQVENDVDYVPPINQTVGNDDEIVENVNQTVIGHNDDDILQVVNKTAINERNIDDIISAVNKTKQQNERYITTGYDDNEL
eukprot:366638_1